MHILNICRTSMQSGILIMWKSQHVFCKRWRQSQQVWSCFPPHSTCSVYIWFKVWKELRSDSNLYHPTKSKRWTFILLLTMPILQKSMGDRDANDQYQDDDLPGLCVERTALWLWDVGNLHPPGVTPQFLPNVTGNFGHYMGRKSLRQRCAFLRLHSRHVCIPVSVTSTMTWSYTQNERWHDPQGWTLWYFRHQPHWLNNSVLVCKCDM